jgi:hypothetical protein
MKSVCSSETFVSTCKATGRDHEDGGSSFLYPSTRLRGATLKMETACSSETLYFLTWLHDTILKMQAAYSPKHWYLSTRLHGVISQKTTVWSTRGSNCNLIRCFIKSTLGTPSKGGHSTSKTVAKISSLEEMAEVDYEYWKHKVSHTFVMKLLFNGRIPEKGTDSEHAHFVHSVTCHAQVHQTYQFRLQIHHFILSSCLDLTSHTHTHTHTHTHKICYLQNDTKQIKQHWNHCCKYSNQKYCN